MHLTIELIEGASAGARRRIDGARPFTIATRGLADWTLRETGPEAAATFRRGGAGFVMDTLGEVSVEGAPLADGSTIAVSHGSRIGLGAAALRVALQQDDSAPGLPGASHLVLPTITSILSDVTPGGDTATGPIPGRTGEEWLGDILGERRAEGAVPLPVEPGFGAHDPVLADGAQAFRLSTYLPEDWDAPGDPVARAFQPQATATLMPVAGQPVTENAPDRRDRPAPGLPPAQDTSLLRTALETLSTLEDRMRRLLADLDAADAAPVVALSDAILGVAPGDTTAEWRLEQRAAAILHLSDAVTAGLLDVIAAARRDLDPAAIAAQSGARAGLKGRLRPDAAAWSEYRQRWAAPGGGPLSPPTVRQAITARRDGKTTPKEALR